VVFRPGAQGCTGTLSAAGGGSISDILIASFGNGSGAPGSVAFALRSGNHDGRSVLSSNCSGYGAVLHVAGRAGGAGLRSLGQRVSGSRMWRAAHSVWIDYREEAWWVGLFQ